MRDLHNNIDLRPATDPYDHATGDAVITTEGVDLQGYDSVELAIQYGSIADSDVTFATVLYEDDNSDYSTESAVADVDLLGTEALATPLFSDDNEVFKLGYTGNKRYLRAKITPSGNTGDLLFSALWILGHPANSPTANPPSNPTAPS